MSHTWQHKGVIFVGNSDLSGDVTIIRTGDRKEFEVPGEALVDFVASYLVEQKKAMMDDEADPLVTLGVKRKKGVPPR